MSELDKDSFEFKAGFIMGYAHAQAEDIVDSRPRDLTNEERLELVQSISKELIMSLDKQPKLRTKTEGR